MDIRITVYLKSSETANLDVYNTTLETQLAVYKNFANKEYIVHQEKHSIQVIPTKNIEFIDMNDMNVIEKHK